MTDRHAGYVVTLESDIREDDAVDLVTALRSIRGVATVTPVIAEPVAETIADGRVRNRVARELAEMAREVLRPDNEN